MSDNDNPRYSPAILERDWQIVANNLRQLIARTIIETEQEIRAGGSDLYATADGLEKLAHAALFACNLDITAANLADKVKREKGFDS